MIQAWKRIALACCGIPAAMCDMDADAEMIPDWWEKLRRAGYIVYELHGAWHWRHPASGTQSGRYTTIGAAYSAAQIDYDEKQEVS